MSTAPKLLPLSPQPAGLAWPTEAWPEGPLTIKSLADANAIKSVHRLGADGALQWTMSAEGLVVTPPKEKPCEYAYVIKIEM